VLAAEGSTRLSLSLKLTYGSDWRDTSKLNGKSSRALSKTWSS